MGKEIRVLTGVRFLCALMAGLFLLPACGKNGQKYAEKAAMGTESGMIASDFEYRKVTQSENGYYFWERLSPDQFCPRLMFMDKETGRVIPLCNRPDCTHEGRECNAYFPLFEFGKSGVDRDYLQYDEGSLYAAGLSSDDYVALFRIKADGSAEWEISTKLFRTDYSSTGHWRSPEILIADGYVYFVDSKQKRMRLERMSITGEMSEVVFEGDSAALYVDVFRMKNIDGLVFFQVASGVDDILENTADGLYCYNAVSGQCSLVKEGLLGSYSVQDGFVYYAAAEGLCCYSIRNQTTKILTDRPMDIPNITLTKDYIILCDQIADSALIVYDYEGNEIATIPNNVGLHWYFGGDSEMLFGECVDDIGLSLCFLNLRRPIAELRWEELREN
ncbi:MAG: DUF5050 domain-containing protein [Lachnospiraceae bacterium]|nr:DUF5050 domain-containing protein [Lachnospiraceae bacterium]